jgi:hypothetical protein
LSSPDRHPRARPAKSVRSIRIAVSAFCVMLVLSSVAEVSAGSAGRGSTFVQRDDNLRPEVSRLTAIIGRVYDEAETRWRSHGVHGTFRLCDDGPPSSASHFGLIEVTHRWGHGAFVSLLVREAYPTPSWDIYFAKRECRVIDWSSTIPADLPDARPFQCYVVSIRVRDPGGNWSKGVRRDTKRC